MKKLMLIAAALSIALSGATWAATYKTDAAGKCRDDKGKFAQQTLCTTAATAHTYKLDSKGKCRDEKGKFAVAKNCHA